MFWIICYRDPLHPLGRGQCWSLSDASSPKPLWEREMAVRRQSVSAAQQAGTRQRHRTEERGERRDHWAPLGNIYWVKLSQIYLPQLPDIPSFMQPRVKYVWATSYILDCMFFKLSETLLLFSNEYLCCSNCFCKLQKIYLLRTLNYVCFFSGSWGILFFEKYNFSSNH